MLVVEAVELVELELVVVEVVVVVVEVDVPPDEIVILGVSVYVDSALEPAYTLKSK